MNVLWYVVPGIVLVGLIVFVHELGHFLVAKAFDVKVLVFSLGFGPRIWGFKRGETEYQVAALPLGGYVRMAGEDPALPSDPTDKGRTFQEQAPYKRALIAVAGPAMNFLLPVVVLFAVSLVPEPKRPPLIGDVIPGQAAEAGGMQSGDRIVAIDGQPTPTWEEVQRLIFSRPGERTDVEVERLGQRVHLAVTPGRFVVRTPVLSFPKGMIGVSPGRRVPMVAVEAGGRAALAGLRDFDQVVAIDGKPVRTLQQLLADAAKAGPGPVTLSLLRDAPVDNPTAPVGTVRRLEVVVPAAAQGAPAGLGLRSADPVVRFVTAGSAPEKAGLRPGDRVVSFNGEPVGSEFAFVGRREVLHDALVKDRKPMELGIERGTEKLAFSFVVDTIAEDDQYLGQVHKPQWGFAFDPRAISAEDLDPKEFEVVAYTPTVALRRALHGTKELMVQIGTALGKFVRLELPAKSVGGPLEMFRLAKKTAEMGWEEFLGLILAISVNLGLFNLLPMPILDGFTILVSFVEGVSRRRVPEQARLVANYVGLAFLLFMMALALRNDVLRALG